MLYDADQERKMPGVPILVRVVTYFDGFNMYFGMRDSGFERYLWLDLHALSVALMHNSQKLDGVKYFTSRISGPPEKQRRQSVYLDAVSTRPVDIFYGKYQDNPRTCPNCHNEHTVPNEKMTDVNIAVELLTDAFQDKFDTALLISADSDLCGPISRIRKIFPKKRVVVGFPPNRISVELKKVANANFVIGRAKLRDSQFPDELVMPSGHILKRPEKWN